MVRTLVLATVLLPAVIAGQVQLTEAEERERALAVLREMGNGSMAMSVLTQEHRSRSPVVLDAFADSLVAIAIRFGESKSRDRRLAGAAASALVAASRAERGGVAYPHAFERLVRIYEGSDAGRKGGTLWLMTQLPNQGPVLDFLADVASSSDTGGATTAIRHLAHDMGPAGLQRLRGLWEREAIVDPIAIEHITAIAHAQGWRR
jgi:hypothetical protein